jgi:hypothetical protein
MTRPRKGRFTSGGYSREFSVVPGRGKRYVLDAIPPDLWQRVQAKCIDKRVSIRAQILRQLTHWVEKP